MVQKWLLKYLARYVQQVALSTRRLVALHDGRVTFRYKDSADGRRERAQTLDAVTFLRRFVTHVPPKGFVKVRHCGVGAAAERSTYLTRSHEPSTSGGRKGSMKPLAAGQGRS